MESILEQPVAPLPASKQLNQTSLHLLPCGIHHDGKANIPGFFFLVDGQYPSATATASATTEATTETATTTASTILNTVSPETSFRGRTLKGTVVPVPQGYIGTIYKSYEHHDNSKNSAQEMDISIDADQEYEEMLKGMQEERKSLITEAQFKEFTMWGHDEQPTLRTEKVMRAMQWFDIAKVLHEPLC
ncbi:Ribonuclease H2 subunit C [Mortierella sp. AD094]|nr:Ribonuclease H2 subunit C [Mortierella sp. AD094]